MSAIVIDGVLVGLLVGLLAPTLGGHDPAGVIVAAVALQFLYFFLQEAGVGKTLGKRSARLRIVHLDGTRPTLKQVAIRNGLRLFDTLPMFYASGLVSVMWTGPGRRQRMGDRVALTAVILEPGSKVRTTPDWLLPTLTVAAVLLSLVVYGIAYNEYRAPNVTANALLPAPVPGFAGDNSQAPLAGAFTARAVLNGQPAVDLRTHEPVERAWQITTHCSAANRCKYELSRSVPGFGTESGTLVQAADGWHADFPTRSFRTACPGSDGLTTALRRASVVLHAENGGGHVLAHEVTLYKSTRCGTITQPLDWDATRTTL